jgi:transposase
MRKIIDVLRLSLEQKLSDRKIAESCRLARSTVADYLGRARVVGLSWPLPESMSEEQLEGLLFPVQKDKPPSSRGAPDMVYIHNELKRKHVTLQILWEEYLAGTPTGYSYSQYCQRYRNWVGRQAISLRQEHRAGEKMFVDYAGDTIPIRDPQTGLITQGHLFVAVLGCSNYTYAEMTLSEKLIDWIGAHVHAFEFFGGVPRIVVPDNTRTAVTHPCRYDPDLNLTYQEMAEHYGVAVLPARVRHPKDKSKAEAGVLITERWILAALRDRMFFSLGEVNEAIRPLLKKLNEHPFKKLPGCRQEVFERMERPVLRALPPHRYEFAEWKKVGVNIDYHVEIDGHYYSAPYNLIGRELIARYTRESVELLYKSKRVAVHARSYQRGRHTTIEQHRPPAHQKYLEWTPERLLSWAAQSGPHCEQAARLILASRAIPEQGYRSCLGLIRLAKTYGPGRLNQACERAIRLHIASLRHITNLLKNGRDRAPLTEEPSAPPVPVHDNLRGATYYQPEPHHVA